MAYKIPKNLAKYSETFLWGLTFKQFFYLGAGAFLIYSIFFKLSILLLFKIVLTLLVLTGVFSLIVLKIDDKLLKLLQLNSSLRKVGYYDPKIDSFIPIREIVDDVVILKSNRLLAVLEVKPIDFDILSIEQQDYVLNVYNNWLNSLDFEVQITSRSIDLDMSAWLSNMKKMVLKTNASNFKSFEKWIEEYTTKNKVRNRIFYIIIPLKSDFKSGENIFKSMINSFLAIPQKTIDREDETYKKALDDLNSRVLSSIDTLQPSNLKLKRLDTNNLLNLYSSYFTNNSGNERSYLTPVMWEREGKK